MATDNFLDLTAVAAYGGRQVVIPFVKNSLFHGLPRMKRSETLALYYNVTALNNTLRSSGHGTLISWKEFQNVCQGKLDVLVYFNYSTNVQATRTIFPCNRSAFPGLEIRRTICLNVFAIDSVEKLENEVLKRLPCVGFAEWRGINTKRPFRTHFNLSSIVTNRRGQMRSSIFFSSKLLHVAQDFIAKNLGPLFYSVHIRAERILRIGKTLRNITTVERCLSNLLTLVQKKKNVSKAHIPVFLAADFAHYGSSSPDVKPAREKAMSFMKILAPINPVTFQPSAYNLSDRGAVAIVEMNILASGKHLFVAGGGSFEKWIIHQFLNKKGTQKSSEFECQSEMCCKIRYFSF